MGPDRTQTAIPLLAIPAITAPTFSPTPRPIRIARRPTITAPGATTTPITELTVRGRQGIEAAKKNPAGAGFLILGGLCAAPFAFSKYI